MPRYSTTVKPNVYCVIMGGGRGTRLYPLTKDRCKPAVPLAGRYRLVDIPISNCINSGFNKIFLLTQFNTASLHRYIQMAYKFDPFGGGSGGGFVDILSAEQTEESQNWYQGTADAVRKNMHHFGSEQDDDLFIILSGDQLYRMDFSKLIEHHRAQNADITLAATPVNKNEVGGFGVMRVQDDFSIAQFVEKPQTQEEIEPLLMSEKLRGTCARLEQGTDYCLASMGIYVFSSKVLHAALEDANADDFGKEIIPSFLGKKHLSCYLFDDYWEDIGTVRAFFEANLMLADDEPPFDLHEDAAPMYSRARNLPPSELISVNAQRCIINSGCRIKGATLNRCVVGMRQVIGQGAQLENVLAMGADYYDDAHRAKRHGTPLGIGSHTFIKNTIIDKNARIGENVHLDPAGKPDHWQEGPLYVRDGLLVIRKGACIPSGTVVKPGA